MHIVVEVVRQFFVGAVPFLQDWLVRRTRLRAACIQDEVGSIISDSRAPSSHRRNTERFQGRSAVDSEFTHAMVAEGVCAVATLREDCRPKICEEGFGDEERFECCSSTRVA
eukprot:4279839-Amphidinium_carterae.2